MKRIKFGGQKILFSMAYLYWNNKAFIKQYENVKIKLIIIL